MGRFRVELSCVLRPRQPQGWTSLDVPVGGSRSSEPKSHEQKQRLGSGTIKPRTARRDCTSDGSTCCGAGRSCGGIAISRDAAGGEMEIGPNGLVVEFSQLITKGALAMQTSSIRAPVVSDMSTWYHCQAISHAKQRRLHLSTRGGCECVTHLIPSGSATCEATREITSTIACPSTRCHPFDLGSPSCMPTSWHLSLAKSAGHSMDLSTSSKLNNHIVMCPATPLHQ